MKEKIAYAYLRASEKGQIHGSGYDRQLKSIRHFCQNSNYKIVNIYREQVSGAIDQDMRPEMRKMKSIGIVFAIDRNMHPFL